MNFKHFIILSSLLLFAVHLSAQLVDFKGKIVEYKTGKPVSFAAVGVETVNQYVTCNAEGEFVIKNIYKGKHQITVQCLGYQNLTLDLQIVDSTRHTISLLPVSLYLQEVIVTAKENQNNGTSSRINQEAMMHIQPTSLADVLKLLPGGFSGETNLSSVNSVSLRQSGSDINTALGTAVVIDGIPESNNANLQHIDNSGWDFKTRGRVNIRNGIDLRSIATDDIESVEFIRGIPSVIYGELTGGAVIIKRKEGASKHSVRIKSSLNDKLISYSKGFNLKSKGEYLNLDASYLNYKSDPANVLDNYQRITASMRYVNRLKFWGYPLKFNASASYTFTLDQEKEDPELNFGQPDYYRSDYNKFSLSTISRLQLKSDLFESIQYKLNGNITSSLLERERLVSPMGTTPVPTDNVIGIHDSEYLPSKYLAYSKVHGMPANIFTQLQSNGHWFFLPFSNQFVLGAEYSLEKNLGAGEEFDITRPIFFGASSSRPRNFREIPALQRLSFYLEQNLSVPVKKHRFKAQAGVRSISFLNMNEKYRLKGKTYFDPRANLSWIFPEFKLGGKHHTLSLHIGAGWHTKMPVMAQIYPEKQYRDIIQLNYYSQNENLRRLNMITYVVNPINYNLEPARNRKAEIGIDLSNQWYQFSISVFDELLNSGFGYQSMYRSVSYIDYDESSVSSVGLSEPPDLEMFDYVVKKYLLQYSQTANGESIHKQGIEYTLRLPRIETLKTRITINGAYFNTMYENSIPVTYRPHHILNGELYPYIGIYSSSKSSKRNRQFNTNLQFDTQIPRANALLF